MTAIRVALSALFALTLAACAHDLTEEPPVAPVDYAPPKSVSNVTIDLATRLKALEEALNRDVPDSASFQDKEASANAKVCSCDPGGLTCKLPSNLRPGCPEVEVEAARIRYSGSLKRGAFSIDEIQVGASPSPGLRVKVRLSGEAKGLGRLGHDGPPHIPLSALATADVELRLRPYAAGGCPTLSFERTIAWVDRPTVSVLGLSVDVTGDLEKTLDDQKREVEKTIEDQLACKLLTTSLKDSWRASSVRVGQLGDQSYYANLYPQRAGFSRFEVSNGSLRVTATVEANVEISPVRPGPEPIAFPGITQPSIQPGGLNFAFPIYIGYAELEDAVRNTVRGKEYEQSVGGKKARIAVADVRVYPSGSKVVVGARFVANLPGDLFDTRGWLYVAGVPRVSVKERAFYLEDVTFTRRLDNPVWNMGSAILQEQILRDLSRAARVDLAKDLTQAELNAVKSVAETSSNLKGATLELQNPRADLSNAAAGRTLVLEAVFQGLLITTVTLPPRQ